MFSKDELEQLKSVLIDSEYTYTLKYLEEDDEDLSRLYKKKMSRANELYYKVVELIDSL